MRMTTPCTYFSADFSFWFSEATFRCAVLIQFIMQKQLIYLNKTQFVSCLSNHQVSLLFDKIKDNVKDYYKTFEAGEYLFRENDDSSTGLFLIKEGDVKVRSGIILFAVLVVRVSDEMKSGLHHRR